MKSKIVTCPNEIFLANIWSTLLILRELKWVLAAKVSAVRCNTNVTVGRIKVTL